MAAKAGHNKIRDAVEDEFIQEGISFYRRWRQKMRNGILPIGIAEVGKTTLISKYDVAEANVFLDFNRTLKTSTDARRLRADLAKLNKGVEFVKTIDVPGEVPEEWAQAFFDNNPRVLVVMVDHRDPAKHITAIEEFLSHLRTGPTLWQKFTGLLARKNLSRVLFVVNKIDQIPEDDRDDLIRKYTSVLANLHEQLNANIQTFLVSLHDDDQKLDPFFTAAVDGLMRK